MGPLSFGVFAFTGLWLRPRGLHISISEYLGTFCDHERKQAYKAIEFGGSPGAVVLRRFCIYKALALASRVTHINI